jgi:hypothetical protein
MSSSSTETFSAFICGCFATGHAAYGLDYRIRGERRRIKLGPAEKGALATARKLAGDILANAQLGNDVAAQHRTARDPQGGICHLSNGFSTSAGRR